MSEPKQTRLKTDYYRPLYGWLLIFGLVLFGAFLLWWHDLWHAVFLQDQTYLSGVILVLFTGVTLYLGRCALHLSNESKHAEGLAESTLDKDQPITSSETGWASEYLQLLQQSGQHSANNQHIAESLQSRLVEQVYGNHSTGWFLSDLLLRLGLMGTVIGFVLMLGSVVNLQSEGVDALKQLMTSMSSGMQVALLTTLTGLGSSMLVSLQCQWLDRCSDQLVSRIIEISTLNLTAALAQSQHQASAGSE